MGFGRKKKVENNNDSEVVHTCDVTGFQLHLFTCTKGKMKGQPMFSLKDPNGSSRYGVLVTQLVMMCDTVDDIPQMLTCVEDIALAMLDASDALPAEPEAEPVPVIEKDPAVWSTHSRAAKHLHKFGAKFAGNRRTIGIEMSTGRVFVGTARTKDVAKMVVFDSPEDAIDASLDS